MQGEIKLGNVEESWMRGDGQEENRVYIKYCNVD